MLEANCLSKGGMLIDVQALFDALAKVLGQREQVDIIIRVEEKELKNEKNG